MNTNDLTPSDTGILAFRYSAITALTDGFVSLETLKYGRIRIQVEAGLTYFLDYTRVYATGTTATGLTVVPRTSPAIVPPSPAYAPPAAAQIWRFESALASISSGPWAGAVSAYTQGGPDANRAAFGHYHVATSTGSAATFGTGNSTPEPRWVSSWRYFGMGQNSTYLGTDFRFDGYRTRGYYLSFSEVTEEIDGTSSVSRSASYVDPTGTTQVVFGSLANGWHHLLTSYGTTETAIYLDGEKMASGGVVDAVVNTVGAYGDPCIDSGSAGANTDEIAIGTTSLTTRQADDLASWLWNNGTGRPYPLP